MCAAFTTRTYEGDFPIDYMLAAIADRACPATRWWASGRHRAAAHARPSDRYTLVLGSEYRANLREFQSSTTTSSRASMYVDKDDTSSVLGVFAQAEARLRDDFSLTAGLRYDHYGETFGGTTNPRFAAIYNPSPNSAIKALYGEAFRAPNPYERYYYQDQASRPPLRPETIKTYELVYERYFNSTYRLSLSGYTYDIDGLITQTATPRADPYFDNIDDVQARGVEIELEGSYRNGTILRGSWAIQRAKDVTSDLDSPIHRGTWAS